MPRKYYYLLAIPVIAFFTVVGIGFWQSQKTATTTDQNKEAWGAAAVTEDEPYLPPIEEVDPESREYKIAQLESAIRQYRSAKSFRGTIEQSGGDGKISGSIEYVSPFRLHATLTAGKNQGVEMIIVGETAYARTLNDDWKMTNDEYIKKFGRSFFSSMVDKTATIESFGIENKDQISWEWNKTKECTAYQASYKVDEQFMNIEICVNDAGQIAFIKKQTADGESTTEYKDFNAFFIIERPMLPLLQPYLDAKPMPEPERPITEPPTDLETTE